MSKAAGKINAKALLSPRCGDGGIPGFLGASAGGCCCCFSMSLVGVAMPLSLVEASELERLSGLETLMVGDAEDGGSSSCSESCEDDLARWKAV